METASSGVHLQRLHLDRQKRHLFIITARSTQASAVHKVSPASAGQRACTYLV